jgi:enamine deaminase RidA (YjgF/YER057c/UK114 family)
VVSISTSAAREVFVRCAPVTLSGSPAEQAAKFYDCLPRLLDSCGAQMSDVILERVFFRDIEADFDSFQQARVAAYEDGGVSVDDLPAASYIEQPPCRPEQALELQVQAIVPNEPGSVKVTSFPATPEGITKKLVEVAGHQHLYISNIKGVDDHGKPLPTFREQSDNMFQRGAAMLSEFGATFPQVLRTWCYLDDIDRDYDEFNLSRNAFFEQHGVERLPASTGIRARLYPRDALCGYDLYALLNPQGTDIAVMHTPTLNEADEYGSAFSRGMRVGLPEKTVLYISGTASVDEQGATVHLDDVRKQVERMLVNVRELLRAQDASFSDMVQVITYLKYADYLPVFLDCWRRWGLRGLPNTFVEAGVCRPDLLCEMEAIAIVPS